MEQRGRKGFSPGTVAATQIAGNWPEPIDGLTEAQQALWRDIVRTKPHDWFAPDSFPILAQYVRTITDTWVQARAIDNFNEAWLNDPEGLDRYLELMKVRKATSAQMVSLATKMRLTQQSRYSDQSAHTAAKRAGAPKKPWEN